jgi:hypothetical protein
VTRRTPSPPILAVALALAAAVAAMRNHRRLGAELEWLGWSGDAHDLFLVSLGSVILASLLLGAAIFARMLGGSEGPCPRWNDHGSASAAFLLCVPALCLVLTIYVQAILIGHAFVVTRYAAFAATRSAIVATERGQEQLPREAAFRVLASVSPSATRRDGAGATRLFASVTSRQGLPWSFGVPARVAYARANTRVLVRPSSIPRQEDVSAQITFQFRLSVPIAGPLVADHYSEGSPVTAIPASFTLRSTGPREQTPADWFLAGGVP